MEFTFLPILKASAFLLRNVGAFFGYSRQRDQCLNEGALSLEERYIQKLDYAIVGIHTLCYQDAGKERNTENVHSF